MVLAREVGARPSHRRKYGRPEQQSPARTFVAWILVEISIDTSPFKFTRGVTQMHELFT